MTVTRMVPSGQVHRCSAVRRSDGGTPARRGARTGSSEEIAMADAVAVAVAVTDTATGSGGSGPATGQSSVRAGLDGVHGEPRMPAGKPKSSSMGDDQVTASDPVS